MAKKDTSIEDIGEAITALGIHIDERFAQVDQRFEQMDSRLGSVEHRLDDIQLEQRSMREWLERIDNRLLGVESDIKEVYDRLVVLEKRAPHLTKAEYQELEHKMDKLLEWAGQVSRKTGIRLPKL